MPTEEDVLVQLATRVPRRLHREIKLFCVGTGISVMTFVGEALSAKLLKRSARRRKR